MVIRENCNVSGRIVGILVAFAALLFVKEAALYLAVFLTGVTVYGPVLQFALPACRGILAGFAFSAVVGKADGENVLALILPAALYTLLSSQLLFSYLSFCTCVSLHLFTDRSLLPYQNSEKHLFGGSLFYSGYFCNSINLRFLFTYSLLFIFALIFLGGLCVFYAFLRGLFF
jgi:hypothetical protein